MSKMTATSAQDEKPDIRQLTTTCTSQRDVVSSVSLAEDHQKGGEREDLSSQQNAHTMIPGQTTTNLITYWSNGAQHEFEHERNTRTGHLQRMSQNNQIVAVQAQHHHCHHHLHYHNPYGGEVVASQQATGPVQAPRQDYFGHHQHQQQHSQFDYRSYQAYSAHQQQQQQQHHHHQHQPNPTIQYPDAHQVSHVTDYPRHSTGAVVFSDHDHLHGGANGLGQNHNHAFRPTAQGISQVPQATTNSFHGPNRPAYPAAYTDQPHYQSHNEAPFGYHNGHYNQNHHHHQQQQQQQQQQLLAPTVITSGETGSNSMPVQAQTAFHYKTPNPYASPRSSGDYRSHFPNGQYQFSGANQSYQQNYQPPAQPPPSINPTDRAVQGQAHNTLLQKRGTSNYYIVLGKNEDGNQPTNAKTRVIKGNKQSINDSNASDSSNDASQARRAPFRASLNQSSRHQHGSRSNQCQICGRHYARPSTLKTHLRTHTNERPYKCSICYKTFSQAANLSAHQRVHTGERPFPCPICGRQFSQSSSVITHLRTHSGERPYRCNMCQRTFSDSSTLTKHCRIHSGEKPYHCDYCPLNFSQSGNLSRHVRLHLMGGLRTAPVIETAPVESLLRHHLSAGSNSDTAVNPSNASGGDSTSAPFSSCSSSASSHSSPLVS